ncbi:hypothetical protein [Halorhodospira abdelmalekii]|uniref:hypothetical protein n=1 Tax=Halorhodospira abdelmalekii TaxID=421629 RepID=UPI0019059D27|nr:hypothetical protein [Halorhodospira abdelmalekii]
MAKDRRHFSVGISFPMWRPVGGACVLAMAVAVTKTVPAVTLDITMVPTMTTAMAPCWGATVE